MTLRDAGYIFFKNDAFALYDNFWIGPAGITFYYNPYEIARTRWDRPSSC